MNYFTGKDYINISIANAMGMDKLTWEQRLEWVANETNTLVQIESAAEPYQLIAAVQAKKDAESGVPTGYIMGLDACSSGIQLMSLLAGDIVAARLCGLINTGKREDIYQTCLEDMNAELGTRIPFVRKDIKECGMKVMYGSKIEPTKVLQDPDIIDAFYTSLEKNMPVCVDLLFTLLDCADSTRMFYEWTLPDGHVAHVPVMQTNTYELKVEELDDYPVVHRISENTTKSKDVSIPANVIQSVDAYVVRELGLRCNYNPLKVRRGLQLIEGYEFSFDDQPWDSAVSITRLYDLSANNLYMYDSRELSALRGLAIQLLENDPFEQVSVHDKYFCSPNHMNNLRQYVIDIYAELAESNLMEEIISSINQVPTKFNKIQTNLGELIRQSDYIIS